MKLSFNTLFSGLVSSYRLNCKFLPEVCCHCAHPGVLVFLVQLYQHHFPDSSASQRLWPPLHNAWGSIFCAPPGVTRKGKLFVCMCTSLFYYIPWGRRVDSGANLPRSYQKFCQQPLRKPIPRPSVTEPLYQITATPSINSYLSVRGCSTFKGSSILFSSFVCHFLKDSVPYQFVKTEQQSCMYFQDLRSWERTPAWIPSLIPFSDSLQWLS